MEIPKISPIEAYMALQKPKQKIFTYVDKQGQVKQKTINLISSKEVQNIKNKKEAPEGSALSKVRARSGSPGNCQTTII